MGTKNALEMGMTRPRILLDAASLNIEIGLQIIMRTLEAQVGTKNTLEMGMTRPRILLDTAGLNIVIGLPLINVKIMDEG